MTQTKLEVGQKVWVRGQVYVIHNASVQVKFERAGPMTKSFVTVDSRDISPLTGSAGAASAEPVLVGKMRQLAEECLRRYEMNPEYAAEILHTPDTYHDLIKLCDSMAQLVPSGSAGERLEKLMAVWKLKRIEEMLARETAPAAPREALSHEQWMDWAEEFYEFHIANNFRNAILARLAALAPERGAEAGKESK